MSCPHCANLEFECDCCGKMRGCAALCADCGVEKDKLAGWILDRWNKEVRNRPMKNIYRQTLDITWRQIYRHVTGEEIAAEGGENWADKYNTSCQKCVPEDPCEDCTPTKEGGEG